MFSCEVGECGPKRWLKGFNAQWTSLNIWVCERTKYSALINKMRYKANSTSHTDTENQAQSWTPFLRRTANERKLLLLTIWFKLAEFFLEAERLFSDLTLEGKKLRENAGWQGGRGSKCSGVCDTDLHFRLCLLWYWCTVFIFLCECVHVNGCACIFCNAYVMMNCVGSKWDTP